MAYITIKDTGKLYVGGAEVSGIKKAFGNNGAGTELTLKNAVLTFNQGVFTSDPKQPLRNYANTDTNAYTFGDAQTAGIDQPKWSLSIHVNTKVEADMITFGRLVYMAQTKGYKELHSSTGDGFYDLIAYCKYGLKESMGISPKTTEYINVRIQNIQVTQSADKKSFKVLLSLVEIG